MSLWYAMNIGYGAMDKVLNDNLEGKALEKIMIDYSSRLKGLIFKITRDEFILEDILQNVYLKAWTKRLSFRGDCTYSTWLHRIAINESLMYIDKQKRKPFFDFEYDNIPSNNDPYSYVRCLDIEDAFDL